MKKLIMTLVLLALLGVGAALGASGAGATRAAAAPELRRTPCGAKTVRLTIINKSEMDIEVSLKSSSCDQITYYLRVPEGSPKQPALKDFTIIADTYSIDTYYVELWDPVYGSKCSDKVQKLDLTHQTNLIVFNCLINPPNAGEGHVVKLGGRTHRPRQRPR